MDLWDEKMQTQCSLSFQKEGVIKLMNSANQNKLMDECLSIILNADVTHEDVKL